MSLGLSCVQSCFELLRLLQSSTSDCIYFSFFCQSGNVDNFSFQILSPKKKLFMNSNNVDKGKFDINHEGVSNHAASVFSFSQHWHKPERMCLGLLCVQSCLNYLNSQFNEKILSETMMLSQNEIHWSASSIKFSKVYVCGFFGSLCSGYLPRQAVFQPEY